MIFRLFVLSYLAMHGSNILQWSGTVQVVFKEGKIRNGFCEIVVQKSMKGFREVFSTFSYGVHIVQWSKPILKAFVESLAKSFCDIKTIYNLFLQIFSESHIYKFFFQNPYFIKRHRFSLATVLSHEVEVFSNFG